VGQKQCEIPSSQLKAIVQQRRHTKEPKLLNKPGKLVGLSTGAAFQKGHPLFATSKPVKNHVNQIVRQISTSSDFIWLEVLHDG